MSLEVLQRVVERYDSHENRNLSGNVCNQRYEILLATKFYAKKCCGNILKSRMEFNQYQESPYLGKEHVTGMSGRLT